MTATLESTLEAKWAEYLRLREQNTNYSAFVRLGEIANCVRCAQIPPPVKSKWVDVLEQVNVPADVLRSITSDAKKDLECIARILSVEGTLLYEETVLLITLRVQVEMLFAFLAERGFVDRPDTNRVDEQLRAVAWSPENRSAYRSGQQAARRNWGLPLQSEWLGTV